MFPTWSWIKDSAAEALENYLVKTRMKNKTGEALLVDPGSPENLVGEQWFQRQSDECKRSGRPRPHYAKMDPPLEVGGFVSGTQVATYRVT
eukprot:10084839-Karenia_brevis.AAC.1